MEDVYLVLLCHGMDDLPIRLFGSEELALAFAETVEPMPTKEIRDVFGTDCSTPIAVKLVHFEHGVPVTSRIVREFCDSLAAYL